MLQTTIWIALGVASFLYLKWRNEDLEREAVRLNPVIAADSGAPLRHVDSLPKPFERVKAPLLLFPKRLALTPKIVRLRARPGDTLAVVVTAYCLQGNTRSGSNTREGIVAADPRVFPLNTEIDLVVGGKSAGRYRVEDTGLLVKGRIVDIWLADCSEARAFGRKTGFASLAPKIRR